MRIHVFYISAVLFLICLAFVSISGAGQLEDMEKELERLEQRISDLAKSEANLRDRQTSRIIRLEEDLEGLRLELSRQVAEAEQALSQEQSLLMEYVEMFRNDVSSLRAELSRLEADLEALDSGLSESGNVLERIAANQKQADMEIHELSKALSDLNDRIEDSLSGIDELRDIDDRVMRMSSMIEELRSEFNRLPEMLEQELEDQLLLIQGLESDVQEEISGLAQKIEYTDQDIVEKIAIAESRIVDLDGHVKNRELYAMVSLSGLGLMAALALIMSVLFRKNSIKAVRRLEEQCATLSHNLEEQGAVLDNRLVELLEKQIPLLSASEAETVGPVSQDSVPISDHDLAVVLGEEIYRIMKRKSKLSQKSEGFDELRASLKRLWSAFREKGYELIDLQGKKYHEDMEAEAEFFLTHELLPGEQVVSRVIRPLIKHNGETVRKAEIEVLVGE